MKHNPETPLNILWITSDQQHFSTLGCKNPHIQTPNLDRLAKRGTLFNRAYTPNPTCTPTRASLITGLYPSQHGAWSLGTKLPEKVHTIGKDFQAAGYDVSLIGKAHFQPLKSTEEYPSLEAYPILQDLNFWRAFNEDFYGFNHVELARNHVDEAHVGQHYAIWMEEKGYPNWKDYFQKPTGTSEPQYGEWSLPEEIHYNTWIAERANARITHCREANKPFFLWASFFDPHPPYLVSSPWDKLYDPEKMNIPSATPGEHRKNPPHFQETQKPASEADFSAYQESEQSNHGFLSHLRSEGELRRDMAIYYGMVTMMDKYIGQILDHLEASGLADNTLIVFTTDHGHFFGQHGLTAKGAFQYEDAIRVPMIVSLPGQVPEGKESPALQSLVDLPRTSLSMAGLRTPVHMVGVDQADVWRGRVDHSRSGILCEHRHQKTAVFLNTYVDQRYKLTRYLGQPYGELFDLMEDPGEINNLWDEPSSQALKAELMEKLLDLKMREEPMWMPRIAPA